MSAVDELCVAQVPLTKACRSLNVSRATYYRHLRPPAKIDKPEVIRTSHRALSETERAEVWLVSEFRTHL